jgi:4-hydroxy-tetrahydrodipicolinate reductase
MDTLKVLIYGVGAMGINMVKTLDHKPNVRIVGAIDCDPLKIGLDLGEVAGLKKELEVKVSGDADKIIRSCNANVALVATTAFAAVVSPLIMSLLNEQINVVTICQELFFPLEDNVKTAKEIDKKAKEAGVSVVATGINPGFSMDILAVVGSLPCRHIDTVSADRIVDFSPYGPDEMKHIGVGLSPGEFSIGAQKGVIGHIGLLETVAMVAHCLGFQIDELRQTKKPLVTKKKRETPFVKIAPGKVCGFKHTVQGIHKNKTVLDFSMIGLIAPDEDEDGVRLGNRIRIEGFPTVDIDVKEEISQKGGVGTGAVAVNLIPSIMSAEPGFHTMNTLTVPHFWSERSQVQPIEKIVRYWTEA